MSKDTKYYVCLHDTCGFKTDKRKAIYTHLVRTHNERKEDYECEYCNKIFHQESEIDKHLQVHHPQQPFTYTCVSRIENVINTCAHLGVESKLAKRKSTNTKTDSLAVSDTKQSELSKAKSDSTTKNVNESNANVRTKASVNASLNIIAKTVSAENAEDGDTGDVDDDDDDDMEDSEIDENDAEEEFSDEESATYVSEPSGLKIKLSLKKGRDNSSAESNRDVSGSPTSSGAVSESNHASAQLGRSQPVNTAQVRDKASKYYDKLEVYHSTDSHGRRCCPFCDYKTSKNTIRVHLSGIHKIHFVKCSLCDYKAAFPHQITQHGIKFHKTTNLNVIQLSKEYRERVIEQLKRTHNISNANISGQEADESVAMDDDEDLNSEESYHSSADESQEQEMTSEQADDRVFKAPVCQTSKTDYYRIQYENGVYLYSCNLCSFKTPVRATIYTHKYRHEEKSYKCGYCDFTSAPRSNVVHHCRSKHKGHPIDVTEIDAIPVTSTHADDIRGKMKEEVEEDSDGVVAAETAPQITVKKSSTSSSVQKAQEASSQTIIKVPQFKRSLASVSKPSPKASKSSKMADSDDPAEYKLSLNKLYRINPVGSPKFLCVMCSYACDTHPKMKHHLYRHRPQKYKCPYCDHRKYPRSYVVRHVRDTHRNKPVRVIDLSKGPDPEDIPEYAQDGADLDDTDDRIDDPGTDNVTQQQTTKQEVADTSGSLLTDDKSEDTNEEVNELKKFAEKLNLRSVLTADLNDDIFNQSSNSLNDTPFTSTPLIESMINGQYQSSTPKVNTKNFEKKKSLKDYRVNYGSGPRYICNKCGYGTENYKTIHNHMYRHESQRYQCPYCGYRRSPKSFVENHIREVHKGHPVIVTELTIDHDIEVPLGSPRQCVGLKRKDSPTESIDLPSNEHAPPAKVKKTEPVSEPVHTPKLPVKWPAPKHVQHVTPASVSQVKSEPADTDNIADDKTFHKAPPAVGVAKRAPTTKLSPPTIVNPLKFKEGNRTTFKTMYKCTFDPETCNHISKDKSKMKQHLFMHVEYKPWSCDFCDMTASQSSHIKNHVRTEHPGSPDTSFKYKKHNYLEKHIEGFLSKGLFTVPVNEYRVIMDMKGNTKASKQPTFSRDVEGNLECPYCPYKTKSGGMSDHVKMKHMQPRFKCHWCDYKAFYRSEVRKHHRKEKSHWELEFKTQELDLVQVVEEFREKNADLLGVTTENTAYVLPGMPSDDDDDDDDDDDIDSEYSNSGSSSGGDQHHGYAEHTSELTELGSANQQPNSLDVSGDEEEFVTAVNTEVRDDGSMIIVPKTVNDDRGQSQGQGQAKSSKFRCGYCPFSAALRVKVKMHCSKKHPNKPLNVIDTPTKSRLDSFLNDTTNGDTNIVNVNSMELKGTKFEQDLRKAGVSKLNLASLFPNSKRFRRGDDQNSMTQTRGDKDTDCEFKKPLEPVVTQKVGVKRNVDGAQARVECGKEITVSKSKVDTQTGRAETVDEPEEFIGNKDSDTDTVDIGDGVQLKGSKLQIQTTYPNCTPVILEAEGENSNSSNEAIETDEEDKPDKKIVINGHEENIENKSDVNADKEEQVDSNVVSKKIVDIHSVAENMKSDGTEVEIETNELENESCESMRGLDVNEQMSDCSVDHENDEKLSDKNKNHVIVDTENDNKDENKMDNDGQLCAIENGHTLVSCKPVMELSAGLGEECVMTEMYQEH